MISLIFPKVNPNLSGRNPQGSPGCHPLPLDTPGPLRTLQTCQFFAPSAVAAESAEPKLSITPFSSSDSVDLSVVLRTNLVDLILMQKVALKKVIILRKVEICMFCLPKNAHNLEMILKIIGI